MKTRHELSSGEDAVEVDSVGTPTYTTYTRGCRDPLYVGDDFTDAAKSLNLGEQQFDDLLASDDVCPE